MKNKQTIIEVIQPTEGTFSIHVEGYTTYNHINEESYERREEWNEGEAIFSLNPIELMEIMDEWEDGRIKIVHKTFDNWADKQNNICLEDVKSMLGFFGYHLTGDSLDGDFMEMTMENMTPEQLAINCKKGMSESDLSRFIEALQK